MLYIEDDEKIPFPDQPKRRNKKRKDEIKRPLGDISEKKIYRKEKYTNYLQQTEDKGFYDV